MTHFICVTCGTQFAESHDAPGHCAVCEDDRQYVGHNGQQWTTLESLQDTHHTVIKTAERNLTGIGMHPDFAIGQRALLVHTPAGNVLWDCIPLIDPTTIAVIQSLGGIAAIAISHPHYYTSMVEWSHAFDAPIYLHADERPWVMRPDSSITFWEGETHALFGDLTLVRCGGHFPGGQVLHWPAGAEGRGALLTGDIIQVVSDRRFVTFMYSYPNVIPVSAATVRRITAAVEPYPYDRIYGAWWSTVIRTGGRHAVDVSADRYIAALEGRHPAGQPQ